MMTGDVQSFFVEGRCQTHVRHPTYHVVDRTTVLRGLLPRNRATECERLRLSAKTAKARKMLETMDVRAVGQDFLAGTSKLNVAR